MTFTEWRKRRLTKFGIEYFYYFSLIDNLENIISNGILPKNEVIRKRIASHSFAEETVQEKRHLRMIELSNYSKIPLHELVPVYLVPRTPTLSARRMIQSNIFFVVIDAEVVCNENIEFAFTDGNAGSMDTRFFRNLYKLSEIPWEVLRANYWNEFEDGRRKRNSEFLIYPSISTDYFSKIVVSNNNMRSYAQQIIAKYSFHVPVEIDQTYFWLSRIFRGDPKI